MFFLSLRARSVGSYHTHAPGPIAHGMNVLGDQGASYDFRYGAGCDFMSGAGYICALVLALRIRRGGVAWLAPPCSSFVSVCKGTTKRSKQQPLGNKSNSKVHKNNRLVSRLCLILELLWRRGVKYVVEQPTGSVMLLHPRLRRTLKRHKMSKDIFQKNKIFL